MAVEWSAGEAPRWCQLRTAILTDVKASAVSVAGRVIEVAIVAAHWAWPAVTNRRGGIAFWLTRTRKSRARSGRLRKIETIKPLAAGKVGTRPSKRHTALFRDHFATFSVPVARPQVPRCQQQGVVAETAVVTRILCRDDLVGDGIDEERDTAVSGVTAVFGVAVFGVIVDVSPVAVVLGDRLRVDQPIAERPQFGLTMVVAVAEALQSRRVVVVS
jgi:hypothetical protein